jgi:hypothetical protein
MKKIFTLLSVFTASILAAQSADPCATIAVYEQQCQDPAVAAQLRQAQAAARSWLAAHQNQARSSTPVITIPVVVHVVYMNAAENISDQQIYSQIAVMNADYNRLNADTINTPSVFDSIAANIGIEFCLASVDPNGNPTNGITRTSSTGGSFGAFFQPFTEDVKSSASGGIDPWPTDQYLNIWVCKLFTGLLGYAQFPGGNPATDGVAITYTAFGTIGAVTAPSTLGRTATHEIGHWLGLRHIWGDDQDCSGSDSIPDTPNVSVAASSDCQVNLNSCSNEDPYWGTVDPPDMVQNYMDYSHDSCMNMFTLGQKARMLSYLFSDPSRSSLFTSQGGCNPLGMQEASHDRFFNVYPSPASGSVSVSYFGSWNANMTVEILDITGRIVMTAQVTSYSYTLDLSTLPAGIYTLRFTGAEGVASKKIVKQ